MELHRNESGQTLVLTAFELILLIGFLAIAADVGTLFHSKRHMQAAADAAATAAALNDYNYTLGYTLQSDKTAALDAAAANGYTNGKDGVVVTVNTPPVNGYHKKSGYVEVIISKRDPLFFFRAFTGNSSTTVAARAVAGDPVGQTGCVNVNELYLKGSATIQGLNGTLACGIDVKDSIYNNDTGTIVKADYLHTPSGASEKKATSPTPTTSGYSPNTDFTNRYMPNPWDPATDSGGNPTTLCNSSNTYTSPTYNTGLATDGTLPTGETLTAANGVTIDNVVCFGNEYTPTSSTTIAPLPAVQIGANSQSVTTLPSGFYIFENGANFNGTITFGQDAGACPTSPTNSDGTASGAVIYNYAGGLVQGNGQLGVCGPTQTKYEYDAIAIMQPAFPDNPLDPPADSDSLALQFGMSGNAGLSCSIGNAALNGYIVAPSATVTLHDQGGGVMVTGIVANELEVNSSTLSVCNYNTVNSATTPLRSIALVE